MRTTGDGDEKAALMPKSRKAAIEWFDKRRKLIDAWAAYCAKVETDAGKVVAHRSCANTAIASPKARGGRPAVAHPPPSMCLPRPTYLRRDGGDGWRPWRRKTTPCPSGWQ